VDICAGELIPPPAVCVCVRARTSDTKERGCGRIEDRAGRGM